MTETVRRVRQDSLGIFRLDAAFERRFVDPAADVAALIGEIGRDESVVKVIHEVPAPHALGLVPHEVWVRRNGDLVARAYMSGRLQVDIDEGALADVCSAHGVGRLLVFGSVTNDYFDPNSSDVDVLVEFEPGHEPGPFGLVDLGDDLSERVFAGREVDVMTVDSARSSRLIRDDLDQAQVLYDGSG